MTLRPLSWLDDPAARRAASHDQALRAHLERVAGARGVRSWFDRFEGDTLTTADGLRLRLEVIAVDRARPTVVFMPGTNAYCLLYGEVLTMLADAGYNVVAFDPRGHGRSEGARGSYSIAELVGDLRQVVEAARERFGDPVVVSGSSQGGIAAFYLAATDTPLAGALCHNAADLADPRSAVLTRFPRLSGALRPLIVRLASVVPELPVPMSAYLDLTREPVRGMGRADEIIAADPLLTGFVRLRTLASLGTEPLARPIERITTPVFLLHAGADTIFPRSYVKALYARLRCPSRRLAIYEGLPHYVIVDYVDRFADDALQWLAEVT